MCVHPPRAGSLVQSLRSTRVVNEPKRPHNPLGGGHVAALVRGAVPWARPGTVMGSGEEVL